VDYGYFNEKSPYLMCLCYLFCSKLHDNYSESKGRFFLQNESIGIDSRNESNRINSNREWECTSGCVMVVVTWRQYKMSTHTHIHVTLRTLSGVPRLLGARGRCNEVCLPPPEFFWGEERSGVPGPKVKRYAME